MSYVGYWIPLRGIRLRVAGAKTTQYGRHARDIVYITRGAVCYGVTPGEYRRQHCIIIEALACYTVTAPRHRQRRWLSLLWRNCQQRRAFTTLGDRHEKTEQLAGEDVSHDD